MRKFIILALFVFLCFNLLEVVASELVWEKVDDNSFINPQAIVKLNDNNTFTFLLKAYNKGQYEAVNGQNVSYTISQYTIDCARNLYKIGVIDSYAKDGSFVNGDYNRYAEFRPIVVGTAVSNVVERLCLPNKNH